MGGEKEEKGRQDRDGRESRKKKKTCRLVGKRGIAASSVMENEFCYNTPWAGVGTNKIMFSWARICSIALVVHKMKDLIRLSVRIKADRV
jgi:hypothetical protein